MGEFLYFVLVLTSIYIAVTLFGVIMLWLWVERRISFLAAALAAGLFNWIMYWETSWIRTEAYESMARGEYYLMSATNFILWLLGMGLLFIAYSKFQSSRIKTGWEKWRESH